MKNLRSTVVLLFITVSINFFAQTGLDEKKIIGKIKSITLTYSKETVDEDALSFRETKYSFNEKGMKTEISDNVMGTVFFSYDKEGNFQFTHNGETSQSAIKDNKKYNEKNQLLEEMIYSYEGVLYEKNVNTYDEKSNLIKEEKYREYDKELKLRFRTEYKYNAQNLCIEKSNFSFDEIRPSDTDVMTYDEKGHLLSKKHTVLVPVEGDASYLMIAKYDHRGNQIEYKLESLDPNEKQDNYWIKSKFDQNGNCISSIRMDSNDKIILTIEMSFDQKGNEISRTEKGSSNEKLNYEYVYDKMGNWTKKTTFSSGKKIETVEREILYYE